MYLDYEVTLARCFKVNRKRKEHLGWEHMVLISRVILLFVFVAKDVIVGRDAQVIVLFDQQLYLRRNRWLNNTNLHL